jgi:hypothetical protein
MKYSKRKQLGYDILPGDYVLQSGYEVWGITLQVDFPEVTVMWYSGRYETMNIVDAQASKQAFLAFNNQIIESNAFDNFEEWTDDDFDRIFDMFNTEVEIWKRREANRK